METTKRIGTRPTTAHVVVTGDDGTVLADTTAPVALSETGLPDRWYLPRQDVRTDLLVASDTVTHCPWKGNANHWSWARADGTVIPDVAWSYDTDVLPDAQGITGMIAFYVRRVSVEVDGATI
jgi:uncharacterized protein (DUF427 family)